MLQSLQRLVIPFTRLVKVATSLPLFSVFPRDHSFLAITDHGLAINTVSFMASTEISRDSYCSEWSSDLYHWSFPWLHFPAIPHNHRLPFQAKLLPAQPWMCLLTQSSFWIWKIHNLLREEIPLPLSLCSLLRMWPNHSSVRHLCFLRCLRDEPPPSQMVVGSCHTANWTEIFR